MYINITDQKLENYPTFKKAIKFQGERFDLPDEEYKKISLLLEEEDTRYIKYNNEYYEVSLAIKCL